MRNRIGSIASGVLLSTMALSLVGCNLKAGNLIAPSGDGRGVQAGRPFAPGAPTPVSAEKELVITDLSVIEDAARTTGRGVWTFGTLMEGLSNGRNTEQFVLNWLNEWNRDVYINGQKIPARKAIQRMVIDPWMQASGGRKLDLKKAPFRLLAIVNRVDLRKVGNAGEGRFVFGALDKDGNPTPFTVIFEYGVDFNMLDGKYNKGAKGLNLNLNGLLGNFGLDLDQLAGKRDNDSATKRMKLVTDWAMRWHKLGTLPYGAAYNAELQKLTDVFSSQGANRKKPNGSALNQLRTNEIALTLANPAAPNPAIDLVAFLTFLKDNPWEMREFQVGTNGKLNSTPVALTPAVTFNDTTALGEYINRNEQAILREEHQLPKVLLAAAAPVPGAGNAPGLVSDPALVWKASNVNNPEARFKFALNTCNGCHLVEGGLQGLPPGQAFLQVRPRPAGAPSSLSPFMTGVDVPDPVTGQVRHLDDIARRVNDMNQLIGYSTTRNLVPTQAMEMPYPSRVH